MPVWCSPLAVGFEQHRLLSGKGGQLREVKVLMCVNSTK